MKTKNNLPPSALLPATMKLLSQSAFIILLSVYTLTLFGSPRPAKLSSFSLSVQEQKVTLQWAAADEKLVSHYMIQRSADNKEFSDVACIFTEESPSSLSTSENKYRDNLSKTSGTFYYRLKVVLTDGSFNYSPIKKIKL